MIDPTTSPDLVAQVMGKVQFAGVDAVVKADTDLPAQSSDAGAPTLTLSQNATTVESGTRVSFPFVVDSDLALTSLFAKVVGSPDTFQVDLPSTKAANPFSFGFDLPTSVGNGTFCIDLAATNSGGLSGRAPQSFCVTVNGTFAPTPEPTQAPTATPTAAPTEAPTATPTTGPTLTPTQAPTATPTVTATPTQAPTATPTQAPTVTPTVAPSVTPTPATGGGGSAAACFNPDFAVQGTTFSLTYNSTGGSGGTVDFTDDRTIGGNTTFDGRPAQVTTGTTTSTVSGSGAADGTTVTDTTTYAQVDVGVPSTNAIGVHTETPFDQQGFSGTTVTDVTIRPGSLMRFNLNPGESYTQTYTTNSSTTTNISGFPGQSVDTSFDSTEVTRYVGRSTISVPAGTFEVCQFEQTVTSNINGSTSEDSSTLYFAVSSGVLVMQISGDTTSQLTGGNINGNALP